MLIIFYIYVAIGATLFESINPVLWGDIAISMLTLFRVMTFEEERHEPMPAKTPLPTLVSLPRPPRSIFQQNQQSSRIY